MNIEDCEFECLVELELLLLSCLCYDDWSERIVKSK